MLEMDQILKANELSISLVAAVPSFAIAGGCLYYLGRRALALFTRSSSGGGGGLGGWPPWHASPGLFEGLGCYLCGGLFEGNASECGMGGGGGVLLRPLISVAARRSSAPLPCRRLVTPTPPDPRREALPVRMSMVGVERALEQLAAAQEAGERGVDDEEAAAEARERQGIYAYRLAVVSGMRGCYALSCCGAGSRC